MRAVSAACSSALVGAVEGAWYSFHACDVAAMAAAQMMSHKGPRRMMNFARNRQPKRKWCDNADGHRCSLTAHRQRMRQDLKLH